MIQYRMQEKKARQRRKTKKRERQKKKRKKKKRAKCLALSPFLSLSEDLIATSSPRPPPSTLYPGWLIPTFAFGTAAAAAAFLLLFPPESVVSAAWPPRFMVTFLCSRGTTSICLHRRNRMTATRHHEKHRRFTEKENKRAG